jgi:hypothetical protein
MKNMVNPSSRGREKLVVRGLVIMIEVSETRRPLMIECEFFVGCLLEKS